MSDVSRETSESMSLEDVMPQPDPDRPHEVRHAMPYLYVPPEWSAAPQRPRRFDPWRWLLPLVVLVAAAAVVAAIVLASMHAPAAPGPAPSWRVGATPTPHPYPRGWTPDA
jgi:hypothetical protein